MTWDQVIAACKRYETILVGSGYAAERASPTEKHAGRYDIHRHCLWMAQEVQKWPDTKREKGQRWVCFIQGCLWSMGGYAISEFKDDNR